jgi:hypothetical protein
MQVRCLSIVAAMVLAAVSAMAQGAGMVLYEHPTLGFSLLLPAGWTMAPASSDYDVQVQDANCLVQVASTTMSSVVDPHLFVAEWERHIVGPDKTYSRRLSQTDRAVAGARAVQGVYDSTIFGAPATGNITVVSLPGRVYVISVICLRQAYDERRPLIESVLTSFQAPGCALAIFCLAAAVASTIAWTLLQPGGSRSISILAAGFPAGVARDSIALPSRPGR